MEGEHPPAEFYGTYPDVVESGRIGQIIEHFSKRLDEFKFESAPDGTVVQVFMNPLRDNISGVNWSLARAVFDGEKTKPHTLEETSEEWFIRKGSGTMHIGDEKVKFSPSTRVTIPPNTEQWLENAQPGELIEAYLVLNPPYRPEIDRLVEK